MTACTVVLADAVLRRVLGVLCGSLRTAPKEHRRIWSVCAFRAYQLEDVF